MAEETFRGYVIAGIVLTLFMFLILTFAVNFASDYGKDTSQFTGGAFDLSVLEQNLSVVKPVAGNTEESFFEQGILEIGIDVLLGIWGFAKTIGFMVVLPFYIFNNVLSNILGVPDLVINVIMGILSLAIIFAVWKVFKTGM